MCPFNSNYNKYLVYNKQNIYILNLENGQLHDLDDSTDFGLFND